MEATLALPWAGPGGEVEVDPAHAGGVLRERHGDQVPAGEVAGSVDLLVEHGAVRWWFDGPDAIGPSRATAT